jgi:hypothetical protein
MALSERRRTPAQSSEAATAVVAGRCARGRRIASPPQGSILHKNS